MKKHFFWALTLALIALFPYQSVKADYCVGTAPNNSDGDHYGLSTIVVKVNGEQAFSYTKSQTIEDASSSCVMQIKANDVITFVVTGGTHTQWGQAVVYFDWNQNQDWTDSGESTILYSKPLSVQSNAEFTITVPSDFTWQEGVSELKVRVNSREDSSYNSNGDATPCTALTKGRLVTFKAIPLVGTRTINVYSNPSAGGTLTVNGSGTTVTAEGNITIEATPASGYEFVNWSLNGEEVSTSATYTDITDGDKTYTANFRKVLDRSGWEITVDGEGYDSTNSSSSVEGPKSNMIDGLTNTFWHSYYSGQTSSWGNENLPHYVQFNLGSIQEFDKFKYVSRNASTSQNGNIVNYQLYISNSDMVSSLGDGSIPTNGTLISSGAFTYDGSSAEHMVDLGQLYTGQYIFFLATSENGGQNKFANCAEFYLYQCYFDVTISAVAGEGGTVAIDGDSDSDGSVTIVSGASVTLTATPAEDYGFVSWTNSAGQVVSNDATYQFSATTADTYTANFAKKVVVTIASSNDAWGSVSFSDYEGTTKEVGSGASVTITAEPVSSAYEFVQWNDGSTEATRTIENITESVTYTATFAERKVCTVTVNTPEIAGGTVSYTVNGNEPTETIYEGDELVFTASENPGYKFVQWSNGSTDNPYTVTATDNIDITPVYAKMSQDEMYAAMPIPTFTKFGNLKNTRGVEILSGAKKAVPGVIDLSGLAYVTDGNQTTDGNMDKIPTGATDPIYISPGADFDLKLTIHAGAWHYMKFFQYHNTFQNQQVAYGTYGASSASVSDFWTDVAADNAVTYDQENSTITFPIELGDDVVAGDIIVLRAMSSGTENMEANGSYGEGLYLDILFYVVEPEVSVTINPADGGAVTTSPAEINIGTEVTLTAEPADGYAFVNWTDANGTEVGTDLTYTFLATKENNYTVNFGKECILTITAPSNGSILVNDESTSGSTILAEGAEVTLTAKPEKGYRFSKWVINGSEYTLNPYTTTISDNMSVSAQFEESKQFSISVEQPENGIIEINSETLYEGEQFIITVTPYAGYTLSVLKINGNEQITTQNGSSYQFSETLTSTMSTEIVVTAEIVEKSITYPTMTSWFSDLGSSNRYLAKVTASTASQLVEVFNVTTEEELPKNASVSVSESSPSTEGALIDKTATPVLVTKGETSLSMTFITWLYDDMVLNSTTATCQMNWTQQALYIDWNSDGDFTDDGEIYDKSSDNLGSENTSFESVDGYTRIVAIPEGQSVGVYRMRAVYYEPNDASEAWHTTLFTDKSNVIRKGRAYDFELQIVNPAVRVKASPSYAGTVTINGGKGEVAIPSGGSVEVTLSATPNPAYEFVNWTVGGEEVSTEPSFTATVSDPKTYIANFQMPSEYVYEMNENGSKYYRIPALVKASDGSLVAIADKRGDALGDLPNVISIVAKRSTDNGKTWSEMTTIAQGGLNSSGTYNSYGDAAVVLDKTNGKLISVFVGYQNRTTGDNGTAVGLWASNSTNILCIYQSESTDNGKTWSTPKDITDQIYGGVYTSDRLGTTRYGMFAASGNALQLKSGRLMFVVAARQNSTWGGDCSNYAIYSDDHGATWQVSSNAACTSGDEAKVVELENGDILMSIKNRKDDSSNSAGYRLMAKSSDGGVTWTTATVNNNLPDPACNGDIISVDYKGKNYLLHSLPASTSVRQYVSVYLSKDGGKTWPVCRRIYDGYSAYSSMTVLNDGTIGIVVEEGKWDENIEGDDGFNLKFTNFTMDWLLEGVEESVIEKNGVLDLNGSRYMRIPNNDDFTIATGDNSNPATFSVTFDAYLPSYASEYGGFVCNRGYTGTANSETRGIDIYTGSSSSQSVSANLSYDSSTWGNSFSFSDGISTGTWAHVALVFNGTTVTLYVDGTQKGQLTSKPNGGITPTVDMLIGARYTINNGSEVAPTNFLIGEMDDVRFWNKALSVEEIVADKTSTVNSETEGLIAAYDFENVKGAVIEDISGNGHTAYLEGYNVSSIVDIEAVTSSPVITVTTDSPCDITHNGEVVATTTEENLSVDITLSDVSTDKTVQLVSIGGIITSLDCYDVIPTAIPETITEIALRSTSVEAEIFQPSVEKITVVSDAEDNVATVSALSDLSQGVQVVVEKEIKTSQPVADKGTPTYFNFLSMPFAFNTADIKYWDGDSWETAEPENHIRILTYNSATRATGDYENTWEKVAQGESIDIAANQGFVIVGSNAIGNEGAGYKMKLQFTSAAEAYTQNGNTKSVATTANDNNGNSHELDKNWNILGVPYLTSATNPATTIYTNNGYSYGYTVPAEDYEIKPYQAFMLQTTETLEFTPATTAALNITKASEGVYARAYISVDESSPAKIILSDESSENFVVNEDAWYTAPTSNAVSANYFIVDGCQAGATVQPAANELPMNVYTGAGTSHRISLTATDGNYNVYLKDAATDETVCLNDEDYTFTATAKTTIADRFTVSMLEPTGIIDAARAEGAIKPVVLSNAIKLYGTEEGDQVSLYTANGIMITNAVAEEGVTTIPTTATGVIIIKVAGETIKVVK